MSSTEKNPVIVVSAHNREQSMLRLLASLEQAEYPDTPVTIVISIDKSDSNNILAAAEAFKWTHGEKKIIAHPQRLGLREHILSCGDLTKEYGSIILFEDDLFASKQFYSFASQAIAFYGRENRVAGISLYSYDISEIGFNPFAAVDDGNDVYFMQVASSWGQAWTAAQWQAFREWFKEHSEISEAEHPPVYLLQFSASSWKKHYIRYLHSTDKYFVFPRHALSTNFDEPGNSASRKGLYQVPLQHGKRDYHFVQLDDSRSVYDAYFEMKASCLKKWSKQLEPYDFTTDIYGNHPLDYNKTPYVLTSKPAQNAVFSFGLDMFPPVLNVIHQIKGDKVKLVKREYVLSGKPPDDLSYYKYKTVSEIIFQEELVRRVEEVYKANSLATDEIHRGYIVRMDELHEQIRTLDKDYHAQMRGLHQQYEVKIRESVEQALKDYQFNLDYPLFSIVTIAKSDNREAALNTVRSVAQQDYPRVRHQLILIGNTDGIDLSEFVSNSFSFQAVNEVSEALQFAETHFNNNESDFHCWLEAGTILIPKALMTVREIFKRFMEVNWVMGMPLKLGNENQIIPNSNGIDFRWDKNRFNAGSLTELGNKLSRAGIFWKRHLWQKAGANLNKNYLHLADIELFNRLYQVDTLYTAMSYLASTGNGAYIPSAAAEQEFSKLQKSGPPRSSVSSMLSAASYPLFKRDVPIFRAMHKSRNQYPPLIRFDYHTQSFYLSEY